jgi:hypothetical protein
MSLTRISSWDLAQNFLSNKRPSDNFLKISQTKKLTIFDREIKWIMNVDYCEVDIFDSLKQFLI